MLPDDSHVIPWERIPIPKAQGALATLERLQVLGKVTDYVVAEASVGPVNVIANWK
jgi:hypothetical protein